MIDKIKNIYSSKAARQLLDVRNLGLYVFGIVVLAIAWSGAKTVQSNYELQKKIATISQQNTVLSLENSNIYLQNQYYKTDQYLDLSARQNLGLAGPGEQVMLVPRQTALKYIDPALDQSSQKAQTAAADIRSKPVRNLEAWRDFLLGRKLSDS